MYLLIIFLLSLLQLAAVLAITGMLLRSRNVKKPNLLNAMLTIGGLTVLLVSIVLGNTSAYNYMLLMVSLGTVMLSTLIAYAYVDRPCLFIALMALLIYSMFIFGAMNEFIYSMSIFGIGTAYGLIYRESVGLHAKKPKSNASIEMRRDIFQIMLGIIIILILLINDGSFLLVVLIIIAYLLNNILPNEHKYSGIYAFFKGFERGNETYGLGAVYIMAGASMLLGFIKSTDFLIASIAVLFIADALATIIGINFKSMKLKYNTKKTVGGFAAFAIVSFLSMYLVGIGALLSIIIAIVLAFVESISVRFNDNITVPAALIIIRFIIIA